MRRILAVMSVGLFLAMATPAVALDTLIDARFDSVRLTPNGSIRVALEYSCPEGYQEPGESWFYVMQQVGAGEGQFDQTFGDSIVCDGNTQTVVRKFPPLEGRPWDPTLFTVVEMNLVVRVNDDPVSTLQGMEVDTFRLHGLEEATRPGDIHINRVRMNERGALVVTMTYRCPKGWFVDVEDDSDWAELSISQGDPSTGSYLNLGAPLGEDILCDGTPTTLVNRIEGARQAGLSADLPTQISALMITVNRFNRSYVYALDGIVLFVP